MVKKVNTDKEIITYTSVDIDVKNKFKTYFFCCNGDEMNGLKV